jgi:hypothetical protein
MNNGRRHRQSAVAALVVFIATSEAAIQFKHFNGQLSIFSPFTA